MLVSGIYPFLITAFCALKRGNVKLSTSHKHNLPTGGAGLKKTKKNEEEEEEVQEGGGGGGLQSGSGS